MQPPSPACPPAHCRSEAVVLDPVYSENHLRLLKQTFSCIWQQEVKGHSFPIHIEGTGRRSKTLHPRCIRSQNHSLHTDIASINDLLAVLATCSLSWFM